MIELIVMGVVALVIFAAIYYQGYKDKLRWQRIQSGRSLVSERDTIPPLELDGQNFNSHDRKVLVIWSDQTQSTCDNTTDALKIVHREVSLNRRRAVGHKIFAWNGSAWTQRK